MSIGGRDGIPHVCRPIWWCYESEGCESDEAKEIYAVDAEQAAEEFFEKYDCDLDYPDAIEVAVRRDGENGWAYFIVHAEQTRTYNARKR
jgi:hypothetical protein